MSVNLIDILSFVAVLIASFVVWLLKRDISQRDKRLNTIEKDIHEIKDSLPKEYVLKADYHDDMGEIKDKINDIWKYFMKGKR